MALSAEQVRQYRQHGVLIAENVLTEADLAPVIACINDTVEARARELKAAGKVTDLCEGQGFGRRFGGLYRQCKEIGTNFDIMQLRPRPLFDFLFNRNLLDAVESLLGPEITCNPIQHLRPKLPVAITGEEQSYFQNVPWHQDAAVTWEEADPTDIVTCWLPLVDANERNGCMQVMPDVFTRGYLEHQAEGGTTVKPQLLPKDVEPITAACPKGGIVFMNKYTPHLGLTNRSDAIRWTIDLRYQKTGEPTGRPFWPAIVVRSASDPASVQSSYNDWCRRWKRTWRRARASPGTGPSRSKSACPPAASEAVHRVGAASTPRP